MTELLFREVVQSHGHVINDDWVRAYADRLEKKTVHDSFGWGWAVIMAVSPEAKQEIWIRASKSAKEKPLGCVLCGDEPATKYHILAGKVCLHFFCQMPGGDQ